MKSDDMTISNMRIKYIYVKVGTKVVIFISNWNLTLNYSYTTTRVKRT